jgi:ATP-dependent RNA helicase SUPV3L1/SUV3
MNAPLAIQLPPSVRARTVTAVLGPTNTGKTHLAIERMLAQPSGLIGLPLRLLAREVFGKLVERAGKEAVALVTGEEKITPRFARYWVYTVEAMPRSADVDFVAIDEVQLAGDLERGHVFTDRLLNLRGRHETLLLGAATMRPLLEQLVPGLTVTSRPRMSQLTYAGQRKLSRMRPRSAIVAFSAEEVYAVAELVRRQRGGAAVVLGALSPRTRNAQVELYQSGDVDFLVATDAIGMGLNLDVEHIAFAGTRKFDGYQYRGLTAAEIGQIAGRAGRYMRDGTFGVTGRADPFPDDLVEQLETHAFQPLRTIQWRNPAHDFSSVFALMRSLDAAPREEGLTRAPPADDQAALEIVARDAEILRLADGPERVELLFDVCKVPDYRRIAPANHADLVATLFRFLARDGTIPDDWFRRQVKEADRTEGDIDTLAQRIAHIRTWTYVANRANWLRDPNHWRQSTRAIEDRLSDALHERLTQRFVDRRTSHLMRRLRENAMLEAEITQNGDVMVEGHRVGHMDGFRFAAETTTEGVDARALRNAAAKALAGEIEARAERLSRSGNGDFVLGADGMIRWQGQAIAKLAAGAEALAPTYVLLADELLAGPAKEKVDTRLGLWIKAQIDGHLKPLIDLRDAADLEGIAKGVAFRLVEALGTLERQHIAEDVKALDQTMRATLRKYGVRFGAYHIFMPLLLKPAPAALVAQLWALKHDNVDPAVLTGLAQLSLSGRTSIPVDVAIPKALYRNVGYRVCGTRAVRIDILERLADLIRPLIAWKPLDSAAVPPPGAVPTGGGFTVTVAMTSLVGCAGEDFAAILKSLGYRAETRQLPRPTAPAPRHTPPAAVVQPVEAVEPPAVVAPEPFASATVPTETAAVAPVDTEAAEPAAAAEAEAVEAVTTEAPAEAEASEPVVAEAPAETEAVVVEVPVEAEPVVAEAPVEAEAVVVEAPAEAEAAEPVVAEAPAEADASEPVAAEAPAEAEAAESVAVEVPAEAEAAESVAAEVPAEAEAVEAVAEVPAEPEMIEVEVWRPGRFDRHERGHHPHGRHGRRDQPRREGEAPAGGEAAPRGDRPERSGERSGERGGERSGDRPPRRQQDGDRFRGWQSRGPQQGGEGQGQGPREGRPPRRDDRPRDDRPRDDRPRDDRPRDDRPRREPKADKPIDPLSPFAKLAALKAEMEARGKK